MEGSTVAAVRLGRADLRDPARASPAGTDPPARLRRPARGHPGGRGKRCLRRPRRRTAPARHGDALLRDESRRGAGHHLAAVRAFSGGREGMLSAAHGIVRRFLAPAAADSSWPTQSPGAGRRDRRGDGAVRRPRRLLDLRGVALPGGGGRAAEPILRHHAARHPGRGRDADPAARRRDHGGLRGTDRARRPCGSRLPRRATDGRGRRGGGRAMRPTPRASGSASTPGRRWSATSAPRSSGTSP